MIFGVGIDICEISRIQKVFDKFGEKFAKKILTNNELKVFSKRKTNKQISYLTTRFSAKESISKSLGLGMKNPMSWQNCEISNLLSGKPIIIFYEPLKSWIEKQNLELNISISDEKKNVVTFCVAEIKKNEFSVNY